MPRASTDILISLYPSYLFSFVMGFAPFKIDRKNQFVEIKYSRICNILSVLVYAFFVSFLLYIHWYKLEYESLKTPMQKFITFLYFLLVVGSLSVIIIFNKVHAKSTILLWQEIYRMDEEIKMTGIKLNYSRLKCSTSVACILGISLHTAYIFFLAYHQSYEDCFLSYGIYFTLCYCISNFKCISCSFCSFYQTLGHMFEKVLENLENIVVTNHQLKLGFDYEYITQTAVLHQKLCYMVRLTSKVTSVPMLISFAVTFSLTTLQIYSIVTAFANNKHIIFAIVSLVSVIMQLSEKFVLVLISRRCMEMIPRTKCLLAMILNLYSEDQEISKEINAFGLQILHDQFEISAGNFFVIDVPIFITFCGAITTYIILFVQADPHVDIYQTMKDSLGVI